MSKPNPNLWAVSYRVGNDDVDAEQLWICAPNAKSAQDKGLRFAKAKYSGVRVRVRITEVKWEGQIDAF